MYADDTTIYFSLEDFDPATRERDINSELEKINIWLKLNKLSLNVKKTKSVIYSRKQKQIAAITAAITADRLEILQKKAVRIVTKSNFIAHTDPLFKQLNVLKIKDMFKVKILKFYYKLSYGLLPKYFNSYIHKLEEEPARVLRCNIIHPPLIKRVYVECNLLFQLIKLINTLKVDLNDQILKKIKLKNTFLHWFWF